MNPPIIQGCLYFVGRKQDINRIESYLQEKNSVVFLEDTQGEEGIGKTTFLSYLYNLLKDKENYCLCWLGMADFNFPQESAESISEERSVFVGNFEKYIRILKILAKDLPKDYFGDFTDWIDRLSGEVLTLLLNRNFKIDMEGLTVKTGDVNIRWSNVKASDVKTGDVVVNIPDSEVRLGILTALGRINTEFVRRINLFSAHKKIILLMDDFCKVLNSSRDISRWMIELISQWQNSLVILSRQTSRHDLPVNKDKTNSFCLKPLSLEDVSLYINRRLYPDVLPQPLIERIYSFSGGYPQAVALVLDLVLERGVNNPALPESEWSNPRRLGDLVFRIYDSISDNGVRLALEVGCILRNFDGKLLRYMLCDTRSNEEDTGKEYQEVITKLKNYSFTRQYRDENSGLEYYRFHEFIRREMNQRLKINEPQRYEEFHRKAASYYSGLLTQYEQNQRDAAEYLRWYRYENPLWQDMMSEWLYHQSHITNRIDACISFALIYFDAFWWWGCYLQFPFCERILSDWAQTRTTAQDKEWLTLILKFHQAYPTGYEKDKKGNWMDVEMALHRLRYLGKFGNGINFISDKNRLHLRAITDIFLAQARRYCNIHDPKSDVYYTDAVNLFVDSDDIWNLTWVLYEAADLYMQRKQKNTALILSEEALSLALDSGEEDYEVTANIYRVRADIYWKEGDFTRAFQNYSLAIFNGYVFQARPFQADFYTRAFYNEMLDRTAARLQSLSETGNKETS